MLHNVCLSNEDNVEPEATEDNEDGDLDQLPQQNEDQLRDQLTASGVGNVAAPANPIPAAIPTSKNNPHGSHRHPVYNRMVYS